MTQRSLRLRLGLIAGLCILGTLVLAVLGLTLLFDRHVLRVATADLAARSNSVAAMIDMTGPVAVDLQSAPADPLYDQPFSGHYWQLELGDRSYRSRSLWDVTLPRIDPVLPSGSTRVLTINGPRGEPLLAHETWLSVGEGSAARKARIVMATDRAELDAARSGFVGDLLPYSVALGLLLTLAFWAQLTVGMRPLAAIGDKMAALRSGRITRIGSELPAEVLPLASEIDTLLAAREQELIRARNQAGDLAHGLKTPLQALLGDAEQLRGRGEHELADSVESVASAMRAQVDRALRRTRIQSDRSATVRANLAEIVSGVVNVLRRTPDGAAVAWQIEVPADLSLRIDPDDLAEAIGALAENAARHARSKVRIAAKVQGGVARIQLVDDGPGAPEAVLQDLAKRGFRADERAGGQGLGLAIVADIIEAAGGQLRFANGGPGLVVSLELPSA